jgi:hypothetical protein
LIDSLFNERGSAPVYLGLRSADSDVLNWLTADDAPTSIRLDFVESPQSGLVFEMENPEAMARPIGTGGECDRCFRRLAIVDTLVPIGRVSSVHSYYDMDGSRGHARHDPWIRSTPLGG